MNATLLVSALVLCGVFGVAGAAKLADLPGSRAAARSFGVPDPLSRAVGAALPVAELALAVLLLPQATRWPASVGVLMLLIAFCAAIGLARARGRVPECRCFGQLHSEPVGWRTLARNGLLVALAASIVAAGRHDPGSGAFGWASRPTSSEWLVAALGAALVGIAGLSGLAVVRLLGTYGRVLIRLERVEERLRAAGFELDDPDDVPQLGLAPGTAGPAFALDAVDGDRVDLAALLGPRRPLLLLFTSPTCGPCTLLLPDVARWQQEHADALTVALLSHGDEAATRAEAAENGLANVLLDRDGAVAATYGANGTPSAVLVGDDGTVAAWLAAGSDWIEMLVQQALGGLGRTRGLPVGTELPPLELARLDGSEIEIGDVIERETVFVFWNPDCGFCRSLRDDLLAWEAAPPPGAPALVVVSAGEPFAVRSEGFASEVLLDPEWTAASAFGADGTPMAVLVSAGGRVASPVVGGGPSVLELLAAGAPAGQPSTA